MLIITLCNFRVQFGKYLFEKFARFFSDLVHNIVKAAIKATTATPEFVGEAAL